MGGDGPQEGIPGSLPGLRLHRHAGSSLPSLAGLHLPHGQGERRKELLRGYYAAITAMDHQIGRLLDRLEELGLAEDTIVIFTSDNGMNLGQHGIWGKGNGTFPQNMYDSSVKVPFIASWPGHFAQGAVCSELFSHYDILPTLCDLCGLPVHTRQALPGRSFRRWLWEPDLADSRRSSCSMNTARCA